MRYTIVKNRIIKHHFLVWKGGCTVPRKESAETLESIIEQRLYARTCSRSNPGGLCDRRGDSWPGLVVDQVHDLGTSIRSI